jgi:hypothetical protein
VTQSLKPAFRDHPLLNLKIVGHGMVVEAARVSRQWSETAADLEDTVVLGKSKFHSMLTKKQSNFTRIGWG